MQKNGEFLQKKELLLVSLCIRFSDGCLVKFFKVPLAVVRGHKTDGKQTFQENHRPDKFLNHLSNAIKW